MGSVQQAVDTYRLIVTRRNASEILLFPAGRAWALPRVEIERHQRVAEQLTLEATRAWGMEICCLFVPLSGGSGRTEGASCAVLEPVGQNTAPPKGGRWVLSVAAAHYCDLADAETVRNALEETRAYVTGEKPGPFARPGWMRELFLWANEQIAPVGLRLTGKFEQLNASPTFALVRMEVEEGAVWFKAAGKPNAHELQVTAKLAELFPRYLPPIFGIHQEWNGWLSPEATGVSLDETREFRAWERVAATIAELQIESMGRTEELLRSQLNDLRPAVLTERVAPFFARMSEFMAAQGKADPAPLAASELAGLSHSLKESCALLENIGLPNTVGHTDFNPGNIVVSNDRCIFLDWAEGCVANPLLTFEYLRVHMARCKIDQPAAAELLACAYLRPWAAFYAPEKLTEALDLAPLLAIFAFAVSNDSWRTLDPVTDPKLAGYFRSLTRRMHREALQLTERSGSCLS
ncbi:MAG TPA: phosphotransferase [Candidatus Acidoferrales bacterium]|nr:phosphotransferase [Candidatus Acidoferrales bacterium]